MLRLLREFGDAIGVVRGQNAELVGAFQRHVHDADGDVGLALLVIGDHRPVIHLVDVIARQDEHMRRVMRADEVQVLEYRIGGAAIPVRADLLLSGYQFDEFTEFAAQIAPAPLNVLNQRLCFVLGQHRDLPYAGIHAIRQDEVDDLEFAAEGCRRFAAMLGERLQPFAAAARHDHRQSSARQSADIASGVVTSSVSHTFPDCHTRQPPARFLAAALRPLLDWRPWRH